MYISTHTSIVSPPERPETADIYADGVPLIGSSVKTNTPSSLVAEPRLPYEPKIVPPLSQEYDSGNKIDDIIKIEKRIFFIQKLLK